MDYKKIVLVVTSIIIVVGFGVLTFLQERGSATQTPLAKEALAIKLVPKEPQRTNFGVNLPTDFPTDIPTEDGAKLSQSYSINYVGQKQLTIVFLSAKSVKENYTLYADFFKKQNWNIYNKYEDAKVSSLYGAKESNDINITISENTTGLKSQVSISVLKK